MRFTAALLYPIASSNALTLSGVPRLGLYILSREHWEGAELHEIINEVLEPYLRQNTTRLISRGPASINAENGSCPFDGLA